MRWSSLTLLYLHLSSPGGNKSGFSGFTIPDGDIWKGLWWPTRRQNVAFSRLRVFHLTSLHQFCPPVLWLSMFLPYYHSTLQTESDLIPVNAPSNGANPPPVAAALRILWCLCTLSPLNPFMCFIGSRMNHCRVSQAVHFKPCCSKLDSRKISSWFTLAYNPATHQETVYCCHSVNTSAWPQTRIQNSVSPLILEPFEE